jgi:hypothetical protein
MAIEVQVWWALLCGVSALNLLAWLLAARHWFGQRHHLDARTRAVRRLQLLLSGGYVAGCAWRSVWPVFDVQRLCLVDHWTSSVAVGRSVATIAELCFALQWAVMLRSVADTTECPAARRVASAILPLIVLAEICSWYSVLSTSNIGHVVEEALWGTSALLCVWALSMLRQRVEAGLRPLLMLAATSASVYVIYMFAVDVPMYWSRWIADEAAGRHYLSLSQGLTDVASRWVVSHRWQDWQGEVVWMTLYFSVAVWLSIALVHAPLPCRRTRQAALPH